MLMSRENNQLAHKLIVPFLGVSLVIVVTVIYSLYVREREREREREIKGQNNCMWFGPINEGTSVHRCV